MAVSVGAFELANLCNNSAEILAQLRAKGILQIHELSDLVENDIRQLRLANLVVRRKLINYVKTASRPLPVVDSIRALCLDDKRSIRALNRAGVHTLADLQQLEHEDADDIELSKVPVIRRIHKYISQCKAPRKLHQSTSSLHISVASDRDADRQEDPDAASASPVASPSVLLRSGCERV